MDTNGNWDDVATELGKIYGGEHGQQRILNRMLTVQSAAARTAVRDALPALASTHAIPEIRYRVIVQTGTADGAGTDANIYLTLHGAYGTSREQTLDTFRDDFENGATDVFAVNSADLGDLDWIRIRHDNSGSRPGWFLDSVLITREDSTSREWFFPCGRWLAVDSDDGQISRVLYVAQR